LFEKAKALPEPFTTWNFYAKGCASDFLLCEFDGVGPE